MEKTHCKFDLLFESIKGSIAKENLANESQRKREARALETVELLTSKKFELLTESICSNSHYIFVESKNGSQPKKLVLEDVLFWPEQALIEEGIVDQVVDKIKSIYESIKAGLANVIKASSDFIKDWCDKVKNSKIVKMIREKLGLDSIVSDGSFKDCVTVSKDGKVIGDSVALRSRKPIIAEDDKTSGIFMRKLTAIYNSRDKEAVFRELKNLTYTLRAVKPETIAGSKIYVYTDYDTHKPLLLDGKVKKLRESTLENCIAKLQDLYNELKAEKLTEAPAESSPTVVEAKIDVKKAKEVVAEAEAKVKELEEKEAPEAPEAETAPKAKPSDSSSEAAAEAPEEEKAKSKFSMKDMWSRTKSFASRTASNAKKGAQSLVNKSGNALAKGLVAGYNAVKSWFSMKNKWVKALVYAILSVAIVSALYYLVTVVLWGILSGIFSGGAVNMMAGVFKIFAAGKMFKATYKAGKRSWTEGDEWSTFFAYLVGSVFAGSVLLQMF